MENNQTKNFSDQSSQDKKEKNLSIDANYDFVFVRNWSPILRWILLLPFGILSIFAVQFAFGFIVNKIGNSSETVSFIVDCIFLFFKYMIFQIVVVATAPVKKEKKFITSLFLSLLSIGLLIAISLFQVHANNNPDIDMYYTTNMIVTSFISGLLGIAFAIFSIRKEVK